MYEIVSIGDKWEGKSNEFVYIINGMTVFAGGRWLRSRMECVDFEEKHIPLGKFQWFLDIVIYIQFITGETVSTAESQQDEVHAAKVRKTKGKSIIILAFKTDVLPILGGFGEGKELITPLTDIRTPKLWNSHDGVRGVYPRASKSLQYKRLKLNAGINRELGRHMEERLLASEFLVKCGVFWSQLASTIEAFQIHLVTTTYGEGVGAEGKAECWTSVLTMICVI